MPGAGLWSGAGGNDAGPGGSRLADIDRRQARLTASDLEFLVATAAPESANRAGLKRILEGDEDFRNAVIDDDATIRRVTSDREAFLKISPRLYFEVLLRKVRKELEAASHTLELEGGQKVAVFDAGEVVGLLSRTPVLHYLADMLSSFTKVGSFSLSYRLGGRAWKTIRVSDADVDFLIGCLEGTDEEYRFPFYKRIADICLFLVGVFPESIRASSRYPHTSEPRPRFAGRSGWTVEEYEEEGRKYYRLASLRPEAQGREMSEVLALLHDSFHVARKPLHLIAENYIHGEGRACFQS